MDAGEALQSQVTAPTEAPEPVRTTRPPPAFPSFGLEVRVTVTTAVELSVAAIAMLLTSSVVGGV